MIVVEFDREEMHLVNDFASQPQFLSGGLCTVASAPSEALLNPRAIGFGARDEFYIPIYVITEDGQ